MTPSKKHHRSCVIAGVAVAVLLLASAAYLIISGAVYYSRPARESHLENQPAYYHEMGGTVVLLGIFLALTGGLAMASLAGWRRRNAWRALGLLVLTGALALMHYWPALALVLLVLGIGCLHTGQRAC